LQKESSKENGIFLRAAQKIAILSASLSLQRKRSGV
jgi:hypothetical protein